MTYTSWYKRAITKNDTKSTSVSSQYGKPHYLRMTHSMRMNLNHSHRHSLRMIYSKSDTKSTSVSSQYGKPHSLRMHHSLRMPHSLRMNLKHSYRTHLQNPEEKKSGDEIFLTNSCTRFRSINLANFIRGSDWLALFFAIASPNHRLSLSALRLLRGL